MSHTMNTCEDYLKEEDIMAAIEQAENGHWNAS